ncbi:MAG: hypothetical protein ACPL4K_04130 [Candidatus Margulisiibacteriota bacterium]
MNIKESNQFIPGIYNYCDRWCEHCSMTSRCRVYADTERKKAEHIRKGEDPHDWNIVMQDVKEGFEETLQLLKKAAEEQGIDLESIPDEEYERPDPSEHPLNLHAKNYRRLAHEFLKKLRESIETEGHELSERIDIIPSPFDELKGFEDISFCCEVISWYHTLVPSKIHRALCSKMKSAAAKNDELAGWDMEDANGSAKVAYDGITRSIIALQVIYKWNNSLQDEALQLMVEADRLRKGIDTEFPGHRDFKRPGFDE